jgi:UDP-glucose 4-epimerase
MLDIDSGAGDGRQPALDLYGTDYPTADGTCIRHQGYPD